MTDRQFEALDELADGPRKLHRSTGEALVRNGLASAERGAIYALEEKGRRLLERVRAREVREAFEMRLSPDQRKRRDRAISWLEFRGEFSTTGLQYARAVLSALVLGEARPPSGMSWGPNNDELVLENAEEALRMVEGCDDVYSEGKPAPTPRREILQEVTKDSIVDLAAYRKRRTA